MDTKTANVTINSETAAPLVARLVVTAASLLRRWNEHRAILRLSAYPDSMLKDIGLSRGGIASAVMHGRDRRTRG